MNVIYQGIKGNNIPEYALQQMVQEKTFPSFSYSNFSSIQNPEPDYSKIEKLSFLIDRSVIFLRKSLEK